MKTVSITVYQFDELNDDAKQAAREWWASAGLESDWYETMLDDAKNVGLKITSFDTDRNRHAKGEFITSAPEVADKIMKEHGDTCETYKTAEAFLKERDGIVESAPKDENGEFEDERELDDKLDDCEAEFLKSILEDYSILLQKESDYLQSAESIDENIRINEYEFTADGKRFVTTKS